MQYRSDIAPSGSHRHFGAAMIPRYSDAGNGRALQRCLCRLSNWLEIEVLAVEAWARLGVIPTEDAVYIRSHLPTRGRSIRRRGQ